MGAEKTTIHTPSTAAPLPPHWQWARLDTVCIGIFDCPHSTPVLTDQGPYIARSQDIRSGVFRAEVAARVSELTYRERTARAEPQHGDLLYSREGTYFGIAAEVPAGARVCLGQRMVLLRPNPRLANVRFLKFWLNSPTMARHIHGHRDGTVAERLNLPTIRSLPVALPPIAEQYTIACALGVLDDKIELNRRMSGTLEGIARALFKSWFVDFDPVRAKAEGRETGLPKEIEKLFPDRLVESEIGEVPEGWEPTPLTDLVDVNPSYKLRKGEVAPYVDMASMPTRSHVPQRVVPRPFGSGMRFSNGDTLVARITPCLENGKTAYVDFLPENQVGWGSTEYIVLRPKPPLPNEWGYCLARSHRFREFAIQGMTGSSGRQRVPSSSLVHFLMPVGRDTQLARTFGSVVRPIFARAALAAAESRSLASIRNELLPRLVSGTLRLQSFGLKRSWESGHENKKG